MDVAAPGAEPRVLAEAAVLGLGLCCALGEDPAEVAAALAAGASALRAHPDLQWLPEGRGAFVDDPHLGDWLKRRKDAKLLARPSSLALPAAGRALRGFEGDRLALGLYLGVGKEPPDDGDSEASLVAACRDGRLDEALLAGPGRDLYPPLLPLRTLPNMALAHISIHLGLGGSNGAWAGGPEAGFHALRAALLALAEGRCPEGALAGAADSLADSGNARDLRREGIPDAPGEAAALLRLHPTGSPGALCRLQLLAGPPPPLAATAARAHRPALGLCGAADGALAVILACARVGAGGPPELLAAGAPAVLLRVMGP